MAASEVSSALEIIPTEENGASCPSGGGDEKSDKMDANLSMEGKVCGVCGDKALGNNFNAITCESCKAFFRRNALRTKEFVCPFSNNCKVDAITRRFCQRCRLKKCFDIGMKKEWIMTDEEKKMKRQKIEQNRKKRTSLENSSGISVHSPGDQKHLSNGDGDEIMVAPPLKKVYYGGALPDSEQVQRLAGPVIAAVTGSYLGEGSSHHDEVSPSHKFQKQPMGPHNHNSDMPLKNGSLDNFIEKTITLQPAQVKSLSPNSQPGSPSTANHHSMTVTDLSVYPPANPQPQHYHRYSHSHPPAVLSHSWMEAESSNSSSSPPVASSHSQYSSSSSSSHLKYPPNKRPRIYDHQPQEPTEQPEGNSPNNQQQQQSTPLLSSLIQTGYPESSPDAASSPPHMVHAHALSDDGDQGHNNHSYHAATASRPHASHYGGEYSEEYERSPHHSPYQNGYHHTNHYSPPPASSLSYHHPNRDSNNQYPPTNLVLQNSFTRNAASAAAVPAPLNTMDSILSIAIAAEFNSFGMLGSNIPNSRTLNKAEQAKLNELLVAGGALHAPVDAERPLPKESHACPDSLLNVINLTEIAIRRLIKMSKKISGFKNMCQEDQIALLKGSCTEMMILRSAVTYDPDRDSWQIPHSNPGYNINLGVLKEARGNLYEEHQRFLKSFRSQWRKDENIMIILCAITLFTPERHNVIHRDVVKLEQDSYYYLLKRYLESILNGCEAKSNYLQLIRKIAELRALNSSHVRVFLEMNPKEVEPLLIEIFDLK